MKKRRDCVEIVNIANPSRISLCECQTLSRTTYLRLDVFSAPDGERHCVTCYPKSRFTQRRPDYEYPISRLWGQGGAYCRRWCSIFLRVQIFQQACHFACCGEVTGFACVNPAFISFWMRAGKHNLTFSKGVGRHCNVAIQVLSDGGIAGAFSAVTQIGAILIVKRFLFASPFNGKRVVSFVISLCTRPASF